MTDDKTIDPTEVEKFTKMAAEWWDPHGKFRPLHKFNPVRLDYICRHIKRHFSCDTQATRPFSGLRLADIGCGGGLLSEPMARLGAEVTGIDASAANIKMARIHARQMGVEIDYRAQSVEALSAQGAQFDIILNMEVMEHVADVSLFLASCAALLKPNGLMFVATLNRTVKSYALAIIGAEYILNWLPRGTHAWDKFIRPSELENLLDANGLYLAASSGVSFNPLLNKWRLSGDMDVNYMGVVQQI